MFINPSRKLIWKWCISWKPAKLYEKPDHHLCMNEASRRGPHCNGKGICSFWLPSHNTPSQQQEGCVSHSFLYMNSSINWGAHYHLWFIVIINFVAAEWNKTQVRDFILGKVMLCSLPQYSLMAKHKSWREKGRERNMEEEEILGPVSMLFTAPLNLKSFPALIYCHFMYPSLPLTSSSKVFEVSGCTAQQEPGNSGFY